MPFPLHTIYHRLRLHARHMFLAEGANALHSPFLFNLYAHLQDHQIKKQDKQLIKDYRKRLLTNRTSFQKTDFGEGYSLPKPARTVAQEVRSSGISSRKGRLLYLLAQHLKPQHILELGTNAGLSTLHLWLGANGQASLTTIEGDANLTQVAKHGFDWLSTQHQWPSSPRFINALFADALQQLQEEGKAFDFIFIDGDHNPERVMQYAETLFPMLKEPAAIVLDDLYWSVGMYEAWKKLCHTAPVTLSVDFGDIGVFFCDPRLKRQGFRLRFW